MTLGMVLVIVQRKEYFVCLECGFVCFDFDFCFNLSNPQFVGMVLCQPLRVLPLCVAQFTCHLHVESGYILGVSKCVGIGLRTTN